MKHADVPPPLLEAASSSTRDHACAKEIVGSPVIAARVSLDTWQIDGERVEPASPTLDGWQLGGRLYEPASPSLDGWQ